MKRSRRYSRKVSKRANSRHDQLLDALVGDLVQNGVASLSLRPLAQRLGVSTYSLTYHFGDKSAIIRAAVEHLIARQHARLELRIGELANAGPKAAIEAAWSFVCSALAEDRLLLEIAFSRDPAIPQIARESVTKTWVEHIAGMLRKSGLPPTMAECEASLIHAALLGFEFDLMISGDRTRIDATVEHFAGTTAARWLSYKESI